MESYQINDLERLTGIKAHTIRIWEKRYSLIHPNRTDTNRRYYDDAQVRKLLNVTTLLSYGHKISKIAALTDEQIHEHIEHDSSATTGLHVNNGYVNDLLASMLAFDEVGFERIFSAAVLRMGMFDTMVQVVYPFLAKTGVLWTVNKSAPPLEWHEIGLLFANYIIRSRGYQTLYFGQDLPTEDVIKIVGMVAPEYILTFFVAARPAEEVKDFITAYATAEPRAHVVIAGSLELLSSSQTNLPNVSHMKGVHDLLDLLK
jgi:DNA-binding transcriptional MerR regulator